MGLDAKVIFMRRSEVFSWIHVIARHRTMAIVTVFLLSFWGSWTVAALRGIPVPCFHDEFGYLLASDTFAHGRLTNPTPAVWPYLETFHVLFQPSYMSKFQPGQGMFLALGQVLFGHPIDGVWLSAGLMCAAICWMLYAWLPPRWALMGGLIAAIQFGIFSYWSQSYWGGAVAAFGGALVFGALPRILKYQRLRDTLILGLGLAILVNTRPLEGIIFGIPLGCLVLPWKIKWSTLNYPQLLKKTVAPLVLWIVLIVLFTCMYNQRVTGNPFEFPETLYSKIYSRIPVFLWQPLYPKVQYTYKALSDYFSFWNIHYYLAKKSWAFGQDIFRDSLAIASFFFGFPLAWPSLLVISNLLTRQKTALRYCLGLALIACWMVCLTYKAKPHYAAPWTCLALLLIIQGLRDTYWLRFRRTLIGPAVVLGLIVFQLLINAFSAPIPTARVSLGRVLETLSYTELPKSFTREELKNALLARGGKYLVVITYPPTHNYFRDWVYNDANIDDAPIVWARDKGGLVQDAPLLQYFKGRDIIHVLVYWDKPGLMNYTGRQWDG